MSNIEDQMHRNIGIASAREKARRTLGSPNMQAVEEKEAELKKVYRKGSNYSRDCDEICSLCEVYPNCNLER
jgi:hypothetical protein